ncbi:Crp/Fnr family transcriptional regulator [soil metagenome]
MQTPVSDAQSCANHLLAALDSAERARWLPQMEWVELPLGQVLFRPDDPITHVLFPTTAIVSLLPHVETGAPAEAAVVGREGVVGAALFLGNGAAACKAVVQSAGLGLQLKAETLKDELDQNADVLRLLLRYAQTLVVQVAQTGVCHRHHSPEQQLCRWLLSSLDRLQRRALVTTQQRLASELGVAPENLIRAADKLEADGLIHCASGRIEVLNRSGIEACACECYGVMTKAYDRLLQS